MKTYTVSTSKNPPSCVENSLGTPNGLHKIAEKIGANEPIGMIFRGRVPSGKCYWEETPEEQEKNLITTRILRLRGLEPGLNLGAGVDTYDRYVYIHGTNHEDRLGQPASAGCVLLSNADMETLFAAVDPDTHVLIH